MKKITIDCDFLYQIDGHFVVEDFDKFEKEINAIASSLWHGIGEYEDLFSPMFVTFLQTNLLRPLYIYYFSILELSNRAEIHIQNTNFIIDIVAKHLALPLSSKRVNHDQDFYLKRAYQFSRHQSGFIVGAIKGVRNRLKRWICIARGVNVLYLNSGKLEKDFSKVDKSMDATCISMHQTKDALFNPDVEKIIHISIGNIRQLELSIPDEIIIGFLEKCVYQYLPDLSDRINSYAFFIGKYGVKLAIISAVEHEDHLALLAAAKLTGIQSLIIGHGYNPWKFQVMDRRASHQGTISGLEYRDSQAYQYNLKMKWFDEREV